MSGLNITDTEHALLAATTVLFSGKNHSAVKIWIKFGYEIMKFVVIKLLAAVKCTNLFHHNFILMRVFL
jgi:hypothetical protein